MVEPLAKWKYIFLPIILLWCIIGGLCITIASWTIRVCWGKAYQHSFEAEFARKAIEKVEILRDGVAIASSEEARAMDKHKRQFDLLPERARPKGLYRHDRTTTYYTEPPMEWTGWFSDDTAPHDVNEVDSDIAEERIEHAARLHYEGRGYRFIGDGKTYKAMALGMKTTEPMPLIDALLAAAEHDREGEGE